MICRDLNGAVSSDIEILVRDIRLLSDSTTMLRWMDSHSKADGAAMAAGVTFCVIFEM